MPAYLKGVVCQHINRSSPVFAILAVIAPGWIGWLCYGMALLQYLIIGLVTSRDRAIDVLSVFDEQVRLRRDELIREFQLEDAAPTAAQVDSDQSSEMAESCSAPDSVAED